jgi:hypothetical protein
MNYCLNIGCKSARPGGNNEAVNRNLIRDWIIDNFPGARYRVEFACTETTFVVVVQFCGALRFLQACWELCAVTKQDCVAVVHGFDGIGHLIGPGAAKYGPFDPAKFIHY